MKQFIKSLGILGALLLIPLSAQATTLFPSGGGTGTSTAPTLGQVLIGNSSGTYSPMATSSLGITGGTSLTTLLVGNGFLFTATSTDSIKAAFFVATSTTATSTFAGDISSSARFKLLETGTLATILGDVTGNARGTSALDIQSHRSAATQVASGLNAIAIGYDNTNSGQSSLVVGNTNTDSSNFTTVIGNNNSASNGSAVAVGGSNTASGQQGIALGYNNTASGDNSSANGVGNIASGDNSHAVGGSNQATTNQSSDGASAFGQDVNNSITNSTQIGPSDSAKVTILSSGNVGIGTTTPAKALVVVGEARATATTTSPCFTNTLGGTCITTGASFATTSINGVATTTFTFATTSTSGLTLSIIPGTGTLTFSPGLSAGFTIPLTASTTEWASAFASTTALTPSYIRGLFSNTATGLSYSNSTGVTSLTAGYNIPLTASTSAWETFLEGGAATTTWKSTVQAWFYPDASGSQACLAQGEYQDGRQIQTLKPEYFTLTSLGNLTELDATNPSFACNGFSTANATNTLAYSAEQYITVSGNATGVAALVASSTAMTNFMNSVTQMATSTNLTGIELDIEGFGSWSVGTTNGYYVFVTNLGNLLHSNGKKLMVDLPPIWNSATFPSTSGAQWSSVNSTNFYNLNYQSFNGLPVDYLVILGYDYQFDWGAGTPIQPLQWVADIIQFASAKITDTNRIVMGIPAYGYFGTTGGFSLTSNQSYNDMAGQPGFNTATRQASSSELAWTNAGVSYVYNDAISLEQKRLFIENHGIKHVSIWSLGGNKWFTPGKKIELGNTLSPTLTSNGWQTQGNDTYYSFGNVGIGDVDHSPFPASKLNLFGSSTDTSWVDDTSVGILLDNTSSTTNAWQYVGGNNNLGQLAQAIGFQTTNQTLKYGRISLGVRGPSGFLQTLNVFDGNVGIGSTTPSARLTVTNTGTSTVMFDSLSGAQGNCLVLKDADGSGYTYVVANNGVLTASTNDCR